MNNDDLKTNSPKEMSTLQSLGFLAIFAIMLYPLWWLMKVMKPAIDKDEKNVVILCVSFWLFVFCPLTMIWPGIMGWHPDPVKTMFEHHWWSFHQMMFYITSLIIGVFAIAAQFSKHSK